ncbi:hypothetical protein KP77_09190 [Jeotgalibacillus alimentarius]|uniref:Uncharacterized protein n=1 Tax=Jeotgalibacillus alimentarius TaxID=135826 RepID=A0A0C2VR58_9BACL|nr:DUF5316 family protein [Jeotgalibacillus alimentarius]KIL51407.1 hypothetical protein KP77_09190 [Jeotgalibacillus alimentarius]
MKILGIGSGLALMGMILSWLIWGIGEVYTIPAGLGILFLVVSMVSSGAVGSSRGVRTYFNSETKEGRQDRIKVMKTSTLLALPNLMTAGLLYFSIP